MVHTIGRNYLNVSPTTPISWPPGPRHWMFGKRSSLFAWLLRFAVPLFPFESISSPSQGRVTEFPSETISLCGSILNLKTTNNEQIRENVIENTILPTFQRFPWMWSHEEYAGFVFCCRTLPRLPLAMVNSNVTIVNKNVLLVVNTIILFSSRHYLVVLHYNTR